MMGREGSLKGIGECRDWGGMDALPTWSSKQALPDFRAFLGRACLWLVVSAALFVLVPSARAGGDQGKGEAARWIAGDAVVYFEVSHPELVLDRLTGPRVQDYLRVVPAYRTFLEGPNFGQLRAVANLIANRLDTTWDRGLRDLTGGGIVAAVEAEAGQEPRIYLLITPKDAGLLERASRILLEMARKDAADKGKPDPVMTTEHRGVAVHALAGPKGGAFTVVTGRLAVSNSAENLKSLIDRAVEQPPRDRASSSQERGAAWPIIPSGSGNGSGSAPTRWPGGSPDWTGCSRSIPSGSC